MSYAYHIGVDFHKKFSHMVVQDNGGQVLRSGRVDNTSAAVKKFLAPFKREETHAVLEATRNWTVMHDWLEEECGEVILANPFKVKAIAEARIKTDKIDATILSHLLRTDLVPSAHVAGKEARAMRMALRERVYYVRLRTMTKNRIHTLFDRYPEEVRKLKPASDLFGKTGRAQLMALPVSPQDREMIERGCTLIDELNEHIKQVETTLKKLGKGNANVKRLQTIPGIGKFFAWLIDAEIDNVSRFRNAKKLAAYAGLVPSTYASGGKVQHGRIIKGGNRWLRWAFVEAVQPAITADISLKMEYERLKARKGVNKAKVAIAHRLLAIAWHVLQERRDYRPGSLNAVALTPAQSSRLS
jgi:transposase